MFENDLLSFNGTSRDVRRMIEDLGLQDHYVPAVPGLRRHAGRAPRACVPAGRAQVRRDAGAWLRPADDLLERLAGEPRRHRSRVRPICTSWANVPPSAACASASKPSRGDAISSTIAMPGKRSGVPTIRALASFSTASTYSHARPISVPIRSIPKRPRFPGADG